MIGLGSVKPHVNPPSHSHSHSHSSEHGMAVWYFIHTSCLVVGSSGMPLSQQQVSVSFRAGCAVLYSRVGEAVFVRRDCGLSWPSGSCTQSQTDGSASVLEHGRRMGSLPREEELDACLAWHSVFGAYPSMRILPRKASSISPHPVGVEIEARRGDPGNAVSVRRNQPCLFFAVEATPDFKVPRRCRH